MKRWKKLQRGMLIGSILILMMGQTVLAEEGGNEKNYTYTVTLYSGNQGDFSDTKGIQVDNHSTGSKYQISQPDQGGDRIKITGLQYGDRVMVSAQSCVSLEEASRYYAAGVRESGHDNNTSGTSAFTVNSDREYVIAYGIRGDMVSYVVNYHDASGNALEESQTFYGTVGDQPVAAYRYIENYQPQAYNLIKTLSRNEAENVYTFIYREVSGENGQTLQDVGTEEVTDGNPGADNGADGDNAGNPAADDGTGEAAGNDENELVNSEDEETPQDLVNLDDEETPLANIKETSARPADNMLVFIGTAAAAVAAIAVLTTVTIRKKKKKTGKVEKKSEKETRKDEEHSSSHM